LTTAQRTPDTALAHGDFVYRHGVPPVFREARGSILVDTEGRRYLDAEAANGTAGLGFDSTILKEAVDRMGGLPMLPSFCESDTRRRVGERLERLVSDATGRQGRVAFELGGAQAVELAAKVVRCNTDASQFVVFEGGYHGRSIFTSMLSASHRYRAAFPELGLRVTRLPYPDCEQCRFGRVRSTCSFECVTWLETTAIEEFAGLAASSMSDVAALIIEPVLNAGGIVRPEPQMVEAAVHRFREMGALIVVDETFTGFHRTGPQWGFQHYAFVPDIVVIGKALTNGITPLSAVWAREPLMSPEQFPPGTHSATFVNNVFGLTVAETVLDRYAAWVTVEEDVGRLGAALQDVIDDVSRSSPVTAGGFALGGVGRLLLHSPVAGELVQGARRLTAATPIRGVHGLMLGATGMAPNVIALNPPLTVDVDVIETLRDLLLDVFRRFHAS
jgi:4-aminobutyrate aminotransferase-like enzyme